jgi:hypothetical protein
LFAVGLGAGVGAPGVFNFGEELSAFGAAIVDEGVYVFIEARDSLLHLGVEALGPEKAGDQVVEGLVDFAVFGHD